MPVILSYARLLACVVLLMVTACAPRAPIEPGVPEGALVTYRAVFIGESDHDTTGTISIYQSETASVIVFEPNFAVSPLPGAVVGLGRDGYAPGTALGRLRRPAGRQVYAIPAELSIEGYNEVWIWDEAEGKPLGLARLTRV